MSSFSSSTQRFRTSWGTLWTHLRLKIFWKPTFIKSCRQSWLDMISTPRSATEFWLSWMMASMSKTLLLTWWATWFRICSTSRRLREVNLERTLKHSISGTQSMKSWSFNKGKLKKRELSSQLSLRTLLLTLGLDRLKKRALLSCLTKIGSSRSSLAYNLML